MQRQEKKLLVIADSSLFPLVASADISLVAPTKNIPFIGSPTTLSCIINYLVLELVNRQHPQLKEHQEKLEFYEAKYRNEQENFAAVGGPF